MGTTIYGQSRLESNGNEGVFHISKTINNFKGSCLTDNYIQHYSFICTVKWFKALVHNTNISI